LSACGAADTEADRLVFANFTLIDGTGAPPVDDSAMIVEDGRIAWIGRSDDLAVADQSDAVDLTGKFVMPGMIDTHVHLGLTEDGITVAAENQTQERLAEQLAQFAAYGVTTVQSLGTDQSVVLEMRDAQRSTGRPAVSRIYSSGLGVVYEGGYGGLAGVTEKVATPAEARDAVIEEIARDADIIKFWLDSELGTMPKMPNEISSAVIEQAHADGARVASHIFYLDDAKRVVGEGVDAFSHSVRDTCADEALLSAMRRNGVWQMASTLAREKALFAYGEQAAELDDPFFRAAVKPATLDLLASEENQEKIRSGPNYSELQGFLEAAMCSLKAISAAGIPYAMGTDAGGPLRFPGYSEHEELSLMVQAGLSPMEAIVAATSSGARFLQNDELGSLETGKWADMIVLDSDPLADIRNSRSIHAVYIAGRAVPSVATEVN
jgi:imidazolonepropionase-like amidohydrolase